ncbi:hypothetical protein LOK49_LG09G00631 [Camellia lanceoleosa]|uniref:Uncharacterized protein n=1 Tax=Camellia lanceoleosa TaxID=1840588 RepID=A0ACC0GL20_9ERIC|nr:hypothetical protein LOK49_LG09G00631 [Camellia lanceoleosa]
MSLLARYWGLSTGTSRACSTKLEVFSYLKDKAGLLASPQLLPDACSKFLCGSRCLSSQAGAESSNIRNTFHLPPSTGRVALPKSRVLYTVLRSPHIDKKSREQFCMITKKELRIIKRDRSELSKMMFWLKRQRIFGAQCEMMLSCKTHLDKETLQRLLQNDEFPTKALAGQRAQPPNAGTKKTAEEAVIRLRICSF